MSIPTEITNTIEWLLKIEEYRQACDLAKTAARFLPSQHPQTYDFLAMIFHRAKFYPEALEYAKKTAELLPDQPEALYNLARCYNSMGEAAIAEKYIIRVLEQKSDWLDPHLDRAMYICAQGRFDEAEEILLSLQKKYSSTDVHQNIIKFNLAWHLIRRGQFKEGVKALTIGRKIHVWGAHSQTFPKPKFFNGLPLAGKTVMLVGEAGAGDEMINVRFAKTIQDRGGRSIWSSGHGLQSLFSRVEGIDKAISSSEISSVPYDYWAPAMDLCSLLELDLNEIPKKAYLSPNPVFVEKWRAKIKDNGRCKIGLRWQGNPLYEQDLYRSVPLAQFRKFFELDQVDFYSLQRDSGLEEILPEDPVVRLDSELKTWEDTAAVISLLDIVVTSCTSIAHLAGALGKNTLLFTPMVSYYIWASPGNQSQWYPNVKLYRQKKFHDWTLESEEILQELKRILS